MAKLVLFANFRNEVHNVDWFVRHYLSIGVTEFHIVDNGSTDGTVARLEAYAEVTVHHRSDGFSAAKFGVSWLNALRAEYGAGEWCIFVDADEMLVYPGWPQLALPELLERMARRGQSCLVGPMIDMFDARAPFEALVAEGQSPLDAYPDYMPDNLRIVGADRFPFIGFRGGARGHFFGAAMQELTGDNSPNLRKIPVIRSSDGQEYITPHSTILMPPADFTVALLHFKINRHLAETSLGEAERRQHYQGGAEYRAYAQALDAERAAAAGGAADAPSAGAPEAAATANPERVAQWRGVEGLIEEGLIHCSEDWRGFLARRKAPVPECRAHNPALTLWPGLANAIRLAHDL